MSAILAPSRVSEIIQDLVYWTKNRAHLAKCFFIIFRSCRHVEKTLQRDSGLSKKEVTKLSDRAFEKTTWHELESSSAAKIGHMLVAVEMLYWIRAESNSSLRVNLTCTNELQRIKASMQVSASDEQCSMSIFDQNIIEQFLESYQSYADFDLNNGSGVQLFNPKLEKQSLLTRTDCLVATDSTTLH
jgi:hypothetical protein